MKKINSVKNLARKTPSIFSKMFFSFVIVPIIPILALLYLTYNSQKQGEEFAESNLIGAAESIGSSINSWIDRNVYVSNLVSQFEEVVALDATAIKPILERVEENSEAIYAARVDGADGWAIARSDSKSLKNYSNRIYFQEPMSGKPVGQQVLVGKTYGKPVLCFSVPINGEEAIVGVFHQCAFLQDISTNVTDLKVGKTGFAFLVDRTNKLIAYGGNDKTLSGQLEDMSNHPAILSDKTDELISYEQDGKKIAYKTSVGLDWTLVIQQDHSEAFAAPVAARNNAILAILATALACFFIVYFMSRAISKPLDEARQENDNILSSVNDGLFLIDSEYTIGKQQSSNLDEILQKDNLSGASFIRYLSDAVPLDVAELAKDYIDLLFTARVKEELVQTRNPLKLVQTSVENRDGQLESKYLSLTFKRVMDDEEITNLLVTAKDVTQETLLKAELEKIKEEKNQQVNLLAEILYIPSDKMRKFLTEADISLNKINDILEQPGSDMSTYKSKVNTIFEIIHKVKGDASAINFELFSGECHEFEELLVKMRQQTNELSGNEFLPVTLALEELFKNCHVIHVLLDKISSFGSAGFDSGAATGMGVDSTANEDQKELNDWNQLRSLAERLADKYEKDVEVHFQGFRLDLPEEYHSVFKDISTQLIRNSMVHGIEERFVRREHAKIKEGQITISMKHSELEGYVFTYKDDGQGINYETIKTKAVENNIVSQEEAEQLTERDLLKIVFKHGFSMAGEANLDAGRGVGLPLVIDKVRSLNGKINAASSFGKGFILKITLPEQEQITESKNSDQYIAEPVH
ncbi:MAG: cache domain-containing protein [Cellvibrionaceae bacterium]